MNGSSSRSSRSSRLTPGLDLADVNDRRVLAIGRVPASSRVLEIGRVDSSVARTLTAMGCRVWGVGVGPGAGERAAGVYEEVIEADLDSLEIDVLVGDRRFDVILVLDVVEHLVEPATLFRGLANVLADDGWAVVAVPNAAHGSLRLDLLHGRFSYPDAGPTERRQLSFFDRRALDDLLDEAGWQMFDLARVIRPIGDSEERASGVDAGLLGQLESDIEALTHQFVLSIAPRGSPVLTHRPVLPAAAAQAVLADARNRMCELDEELRQLRKRHLPDLMDQLDEIREKSLERKNKLKDILSAIRESSAEREP